MAKEYEKTAPRVLSLLDALLKARKWKTSSLLQAAPDADEPIEVPEVVDCDEERLEGTGRQRSISDSSQEQSEDLEKHNAALLNIVWMLASCYFGTFMH
jgi:hypothetical protein